MQRAFDTAKARLGELHDRDAILDAFFEYARGFFRIGVLFVVKGATASGRSGHGFEVPLDLIQRLAFSLEQPGVLAKARELRRPFVVAGAMTDCDERLFGSLGRVMYGGVVVPIVVRDRVVAIFLGDAVVDVPKNRADAVGRAPIELAKEEMLLWATSAGEALERHILRRKTTGSTPPAGGSVRPPPSSALAAPRVPLASRPPAPRRRRLVAFGAVAGAAVVALGIVGWWRWSAPPTEASTKPVAGRLAGWPGSVDPIVALEIVRSTSGVPRSARLASLSAEVDHRGHVDFRQPAQNETSTHLAFTFVDEMHAWELSIDRSGTLRIEPSACAPTPCRPPVPPPRCTPGQIRVAGGAAGGLSDDDRTLVTYADRRDEGGSGAEWLFSVASRGQVRLDDRSCKPLPGEQLPPRAIPLVAVPGAPRDVDPGALVPLARTQAALAEDAVLLEVSANGVRAGGRVDLGGAEAAIRYSFGETARRAGRPRFRQVVVGKEGMSVAKEFDANALLARLGSGTLPPPWCTFAQAYEYMTLGTPAAGAAANMSYAPGATGQSGAWRIEIPSAGARGGMTDVACKTWHSARELTK